MSLIQLLSRYVRLFVVTVPSVLLILVFLNVCIMAWLLVSHSLGAEPAGFAKLSSVLVVLIKIIIAILALFVCSCFSAGLFKLQNRYLLFSVQLTAFVCLFILLSTLYTMMPALLFMSAAAERTAAVSLWYIVLDNGLGVYSLMETILNVVLSSAWLYSFIAISYTHTLTVTMVMIFILPLVSFRLTYEYMTALVLAMVIASPFWLIWPAVAPLQLSMTESLDTTSYASALAAATTEVNALYEVYEGTSWAKQTSDWILLWEDVHELGYGYAISSNPSMHTAWGIFVVWYLWRIRRVFGLLALPFLFGDIAGTMVFLQHYLIDIPLGLVIAVVSVWLAARTTHLPDEFMQKFWFGPFLWLGKLGRKIGVHKDV